MQINAYHPPWYIHLPVMIAAKTACICPPCVDTHKQGSYYIENPVDIPNIRAPVFEAMVRFIYTRELEPGLTSAAVTAVTSAAVTAVELLQVRALSLTCLHVLVHAKFGLWHIHRL